MEWPRGKVLNTLTEMYLILRTKAFFGNYSFSTPPVWETSCMHCSGVILAHSSTQIPHRFSIKSGDWLGHFSSFTFFLWNQLRVFLAVYWIIVLLKCPPSFHLHHPGRSQQSFVWYILSGTYNVSVHFSIHPFNYMNFTSAKPWSVGVMCTAIWPPNMVCIMAFKE